jgi:hypothetical protein
MTKGVEKEDRGEEHFCPVPPTICDDQQDGKRVGFDATGPVVVVVFAVPAAIVIVGVVVVESHHRL